MTRKDILNTGPCKNRQPPLILAEELERECKKLYKKIDILKEENEFLRGEIDNAHDDLSLLEVKHKNNNSPFVLNLRFRTISERTRSIKPVSYIGGVKNV